MRAAAVTDRPLLLVLEPRLRLLATIGPVAVLAHMAQQYEHAALCTLTGAAVAILPAAHVLSTIDAK